MNCWHCDRPANGVCRFCGRGICKDHAKFMPYAVAAFVHREQLNALSVDNVLWCGICKPSDEPIEICELKDK